LSEEEDVVVNSADWWIDGGDGVLRDVEWKDMVRGHETSQLGFSHVKATASESVLEHTIGDALRLAVEMWPDKSALVEGVIDVERARTWTYSELLAESERVAAALLSRFEPGDHVAIWMANKPEWLLVEFGAALAGLVLVTVNPAFSEHELVFVLKQSKARGIIVQDVFRERNLVSVLESVRGSIPSLAAVVALSGWQNFLLSGAAETPMPDVRATDVAQIQYTSGTTGVPKGARLTHRNLANNARIYARTIGAGPNDIWVNPMPMFHTAGCGLATLGALQTGGTQVLPPAFDPELMLRLFEVHRGTIMLSVPTMLIRMLEHPSIAQKDLTSWRLVTLGGAPVPPDLVRRAEAIGIKVAIGFGQTEASPYLTHTVPDDPNPDWVNTVGRPMAQTEIKIIDPQTGETVPIGAIGEICARGYSIMLDYFESPEETREALDNDGWLHTGDLGSIDEHGYCRVQGRRKDMIIRGGENIYPREIEDVLHCHPSVSAVSVVGVPDDDLGEVLVAFVQLKLGKKASDQELMEFCRSRLASFKVPRIWRFIDRLPQTASGKIQKFVLRDSYLSKANQ
jgi:fatty-acyl-CoA synthase